MGVGVLGRWSAVVQDQRGEEHVLYFIQDTGRRLGNELTVRAREVERASPVRDAEFGGSDIAVDPCFRGLSEMWQVAAVVEDQDEQRWLAAARLGMFLARAAHRRVDLLVQWQAEMDRGTHNAVVKLQFDSLPLAILLSVKGEGAAGAASLHATGDTASNGRSFCAMLLEPMSIALGFVPRGSEVERASPVRHAAFGGSDIAVDLCMRGSDADVAVDRSGGGPREGAARIIACGRSIAPCGRRHCAVWQETLRQEPLRRAAGHTVGDGAAGGRRRCCKRWVPLRWQQQPSGCGRQAL